MASKAPFIQEKVVRRSGDAEKRSESAKTISEIGSARSRYRICRDRVEKLGDNWEHERAMTDKARAALDGAKERLASAQEDIDADYLPEGAQPKARIAKRDKYQSEVSFLENGLEAQRRSTIVVFEQLGKAEKELFEADRDLAQFVDEMEKSEMVTEVQVELDRDRSARLARIETQRARRWESEQKQAIGARAKQIQELSEKAGQQLEVAASANKAARARLRETTKQQIEVVEKIKEARDAHHADRLEAILQLKADQNAARAVVATQAEKHVRKVKKARDELERDKATMLAKGLNPYVEFRKKELDAEAKAREKKMKDAVEENKAALTERLAREEGDRRLEALARLREKEYEKKHRDEQGRHVIEERNQQYITSVTTGGREVLDPTGRASRVDPSQVTDIPDHSFGLGKSQRIPAEAMARITEKIRQKLRVDREDLGEYQHLAKGLMTLPKPGEPGAESKVALAFAASDGATSALSAEALQAQQEEERAAEKRMAELRSLGSRDGPMPGIDKATVNVNLGQERGEAIKTELLKLAAEETGGELNLDASLNEGVAKYATREPSKFEKDSFERAKERQRQRLLQGTEQVAGGRLFQGQAFVPKPAEVLYKDFEVGKVYDQTFTLTNASYTFNSFKLLDLDDAIIDFFVIKFERPGRMSAGVSCPIHITFTPQVRQDIFSSIKLLTETGPVEIPLRCLIKRCAPRVVTNEIDFGSMVIGQHMTQLVHINNTQALPSNIVVTRVERVAPPPPPPPLPLAEGESAGSEEGEGAGNAMPPPTSARQSSPRPAAAAADSGPELELELELEDKTDRPADTDVELAARVRRVTSEVLRRKQREFPAPLSLKSNEGAVPGYGASTLTVVCAPLLVGPIEQIFNVVFSEVKDADKSVNDLGELVTRQQTLTVRVKGEKLAIFVDSDDVDMRTCFHDRIYRKRLEVRNRAKTAYRVNVKIPALFKGLVSVSPDMVFVQGRSSQFLNIKFSPTPELLAKIGHFCVLREGFLDAALVSLPIELQVVNQDLPVFFVVRSEVTSSALSLSTNSLNFGKVYVNQRSTQQLRVKNTSLLPQKIAFVRLKRELSVQPNDGFAVLLPNQETVFEVSFSVASATTLEMELQLMTSCNDKYIIKVSAQGVEAPIEFDKAVFHMRTTGPGERVLESAIVRNTSSRTQCFEICPPDSRFTWLKVSPAIVELEAGRAARIEIEYLPPGDAAQLDPVDWHQQLLQALETDGKGASSPLEQWREESGWVFAKGTFGELQWVKEGAGIPPAAETDAALALEGGPVVEGGGRGESAAAAAAAEGEPETKEGGEPSEGAVDVSGKGKALPESESESADDRPTDLPREEWGVSGRWTIPVCIRSRASSAGSATQIARRSINGALTSDSAGPGPMFIEVHTMVTLPQIEADPKVLDFGQLAIGTRELRTIKLINRSTTDSINLKFDGINAVGPFAMIRPPRELAPGEMRTIVVECLPVQPGLTVEILTLRADDAIGGHQLRIPLRAQGLKPTIELDGVAKPPKNWDPRSGVLDMGSVVPADKVVQKFTVVNRSAFSVEVNILRSVGKGLSPAARAQLLERTISGRPIIAYRPERVNIPQGGKAEVEVTFDPDRWRFVPFREDLDVVVGQTDEVLRVGIVGRCFPRQCFVRPANPVDEPFHRVLQPGGSGVLPVEDLLRVHPSPQVRQAALDAAKYYSVELPALPPLTLEFPDPFCSSADPASYTEVGGGGGAAAPAKGAKGAAAPAAADGSRSQVKRFLVCCVKINDGRPGSGNGTFEVALSQKAKDSGLWQLSADKGAVNVGQDVAVDVTCTLPKPQGVGGLAVGSWTAYEAEVVIKGGWAMATDGLESRVPIVLKCFLSL